VPSATMPQNGDRAQPLLQILQDEGLSFADVMRLCDDRRLVSEKTISRIARGLVVGSDRSRVRILRALNNNENKLRTYTWADLYREPPTSSRIADAVDTDPMLVAR